MTTRTKVRTPLAYNDDAEAPCPICAAAAQLDHRCDPDTVHQRAVMLLDYETELRAARAEPHGRTRINPNS